MYTLELIEWVRQRSDVSRPHKRELQLEIGFFELPRILLEHHQAQRLLLLVPGKEKYL